MVFSTSLFGTRVIECEVRFIPENPRDIKDQNRLFPNPKRTEIGKTTKPRHIIVKIGLSTELSFIGLPTPVLIV